MRAMRNGKFYESCRAGDEFFRSGEPAMVYGGDEMVIG